MVISPQKRLGLFPVGILKISTGFGDMDLKGLVPGLVQVYRSFDPPNVA